MLYLNNITFLNLQKYWNIDLLMQQLTIYQQQGTYANMINLLQDPVSVFAYRKQFPDMTIFLNIQELGIDVSLNIPNPNQIQSWKLQGIYQQLLASSPIITSVNDILCQVAQNIQLKYKFYEIVKITQVQNPITLMTMDQIEVIMDVRQLVDGQRYILKVVEAMIEPQKQIQQIVPQLPTAIPPAKTDLAPLKSDLQKLANQDQLANQAKSNQNQPQSQNRNQAQADIFKPKQSSKPASQNSQNNKSNATTTEKVLLQKQTLQQQLQQIKPIFEEVNRHSSLGEEYSNYEKIEAQKNIQQLINQKPNSSNLNQKQGQGKDQLFNKVQQLVELQQKCQTIVQNRDECIKEEASTAQSSFTYQDETNKEVKINPQLIKQIQSYNGILSPIPNSKFKPENILNKQQFQRIKTEQGEEDASKPFQFVRYSKEEMEVQHLRNFVPFFPLTPVPFNMGPNLKRKYQSDLTVDTPEFEDFANDIQELNNRDSLIQKVKQLSIQRGFKLNPHNLTYSCIQFTCTKICKIRHEDQNSQSNLETITCPFQVVYDRTLESEISTYLDETTQQETSQMLLKRLGTYFLHRYRSYHNHDLDLNLIYSDLAEQVPQVAKVGKANLSINKQTKMYDYAMEVNRDLIYGSKNFEKYAVDNTGSRYIWFLSQTNSKLVAFKDQDPQHIQEADDNDHFSSQIGERPYAVFDIILQSCINKIRKQKIDLSKMKLKRKRNLNSNLTLEAILGKRHERFESEEEELNQIQNQTQQVNNSNNGTNNQASGNANSVYSSHYKKHQLQMRRKTYEELILGTSDEGDDNKIYQSYY
ncbi:UNKNOWN [Stylonychia lemnae]|uniref:Uncharacterized protein n=1 Tax=Stylonychia lemnae TaxID=5949 RepID=A0A078AXI8_STYLE|nr:UNKNOWN [Stylonychia lemnae]|eukprot:CDW85947.1 UNKNOWN [Stylonychia lemnae]